MALIESVLAAAEDRLRMGSTSPPETRVAKPINRFAQGVQPDGGGKTEERIR